MQSTRDKGTEGETLACYYLLKQGYQVIYRNWYCDHGEIDLICEKDRNLVFVEVKYVTSTLFISPNELFNYKKIQHLRRTVGIFLASNHLLNIKWRLDLLCITKEHGKVWVEQYVNILEDV